MIFPDPGLAGSAPTRTATRTAPEVIRVIFSTMPLMFTPFVRNEPMTKLDEL